MAKLAAGALFAAIALAVSGGASSGTSPQSCPRGALPLVGANPLLPAARVVLAHESPKARAQVQGASIASLDLGRGGAVTQQCGVTIAKRTVVVHVLRLAYLPAQSVAQGVYYVSRFRSGYRIWEVAH